MCFRCVICLLAMVVGSPCCTQALQHCMSDRLPVPLQGALPLPVYPSSKQVLKAPLPLVLITCL